jgi:hypothetical protein
VTDETDALFAITPAAPSAEGGDEELDRVARRLMALDQDGTRTARALRRTVDMLLDGQHTGRFRWDQLYKTEKTHAGTLVEINLQREFGFPGGHTMDYSIEGIDVDCKYSQDLAKWMIPPEAMGHLCLGLWADDQKARWSAGLFRVREEVLNSGGNRDAKRTLNASGLRAVHWLHRDRPLPENVLLRLSQADIDEIFKSRYGTKRLDELFRRAQRRLVSRNVVATVAQQDDYMRRIRGNGGSRSALRPEGIVIFGQYSAHAVLARQLGLPVPGPGESVSARLAPAAPAHSGAPRITLGGSDWVLAREDDPVCEAPLLPNIQKHDADDE